MMLAVTVFRLDATSTSKLVDLRFNSRTKNMSLRANLSFRALTRYLGLISKPSPNAAKMVRTLSIRNSVLSTTIIKKKRKRSVAAQYVSQMR